MKHGKFEQQFPNCAGALALFTTDTAPAQHSLPNCQNCFSFLVFIDYLFCFQPRKMQNDSLDIEENFAVAAACLSIANTVTVARRKRRRGQKRMWVKPWIANRECEGSYHKLMKELEQDPEHYKNYMRMDPSTFEELATKLEPLLKKCDTKMRNAISPQEQLAVTLRFLATGETFTSLQYQFLINKGTIC